MLKAKGTNGLANSLDNAMNMIKYLTGEVSKRTGFRLIIDEPFEFTNVCFWYIPEKLRDVEETSEWWDTIYKIAPKIKEKMIKTGTLMVGYSPLPHKQKGNFIRMVLSCYPPATKENIDFVLDEIHRLGKDI